MHGVMDRFYVRIFNLESNREKARKYKIEQIGRTIDRLLTDINCKSGEPVTDRIIILELFNRVNDNATQ